MDKSSTQQFLAGSSGRGDVTVLLDALATDTGTPANNLKAGVEYAPYGEILRSQGALADLPFRFQSKWALGQNWAGAWPVDLLDFGRRAYAPALGRFISRDPLGEAGGANLYHYCGNDPVNRTDPYGLSFRDWWRRVFPNDPSHSPVEPPRPDCTGTRLPFKDCDDSGLTYNFGWGLDGRGGHADPGGTSDATSTPGAGSGAPEPATAPGSRAKQVANLVITTIFSPLIGAGNMLETLFTHPFRGLNPLSVDFYPRQALVGVDVIGGVAVGLVFGDIFAKQDVKPGTTQVFVNGMHEGPRERDLHIAETQNANGEVTTGIKNLTGGWIGDGIQVLVEALGFITPSSINMAYVMRETGAASIVGYSNGASVAYGALMLLSPSEREGLSFQVTGPQSFIDHDFAGIAFSRNLRNSGDPVPYLDPFSVVTGWFGDGLQRGHGVGHGWSQYRDQIQPAPKPNPIIPKTP